jgi:hypothetical protein
LTLWRRHAGRTFFNGTAGGPVQAFANVHFTLMTIIEFMHELLNAWAEHKRFLLVLLLIWLCLMVAFVIATDIEFFPLSY